MLGTKDPCPGSKGRVIGSIPSVVLVVLLEFVFSRQLKMLAPALAIGLIFISARTPSKLSVRILLLNCY